MDLYKARLITVIVAFGLIVGVCFAAVIKYLVPALAISWNIFSAIVVYFIILESLLVGWVESNARKKNEKQLVRIYMLSKVIKVLITLVVILLYILYDKTMIKWFIIDYIIFYLMFLVAESLTFVNIEKHYNIKK